jgi:hypothetical protein
MKQIKNILALLFAFAFAFSVNAQFYPGPASGAIIGTTTPFLIATATTNLQASATSRAVAFNFPVGPNGVGIQTTVYAADVSTKALVVTNIGMSFQGSTDGYSWIDTPANVNSVVILATPSSTTLYTTYTNLPVVNAAAHNNLANLRYLRPSWITNNNGTNWLYISNCVWSVR